MARILSGIRCANLRYGAIKCGMDTAQNNRDFLWLGHSLLTVKGDDNQEVAEKIKASIIRCFYLSGKPFGCLCRTNHSQIGLEYINIGV